MGLAREFTRQLENDGVSLGDQSDAIAGKIAEIKAHIEVAVAEDKEGGRPLDKVWVSRATAAKRMFGIEHQRVLKRLGQEKREERRAGSTSFGRRFIESAKRLLPDDQFREIWEEADEQDRLALPGNAMKKTGVTLARIGVVLIVLGFIGMTISSVVLWSH